MANLLDLLPIAKESVAPASARVQPQGYREVRSPCDQLHADAVRIVDEDGAAGSLHFRAGDHALDGCSGRLGREVRHGKPEVVDRLDPAGFGVRADVIAPADVKFHLRGPAIRYLGAEQLLIELLRAVQIGDGDLDMVDACGGVWHRLSLDGRW